MGVTVQSGCSAAPWAVQPSPKKHAEDLAQKLGCPIVPTPDMVDCIRTFSPKIIMKVSHTYVSSKAYNSRLFFSRFLIQCSAVLIQSALLGKVNQKCENSEY